MNTYNYISLHWYNFVNQNFETLLILAILACVGYIQYRQAEKIKELDEGVEIALRNIRDIVFEQMFLDNKKVSKKKK